MYICIYIYIHTYIDGDDAGEAGEGVAQRRGGQRAHVARTACIHSKVNEAYSQTKRMFSNTGIVTPR